MTVPSQQDFSLDRWFKKPIQQLEHEASALFSQEWRIFAVLLRCSLSCYPHRKPVVVRPRIKGGTFEDWCRLFQERVRKRLRLSREDLDNEEVDLDDDGDHRPLRNTDLCAVLGWNPITRHTEVADTMAWLRNVGLVRPNFPFTIESDPDVVPPEDGWSTPPEANTQVRRFKLANLTIEISGCNTPPENSSTPPENDAVLWAESLCTEWRRELSALREKYRTLAKERSTDARILICSPRVTKNIQKRGEKNGRDPHPAAPPSSSNPPTPPVAPPVPPAPPVAPAPAVSAEPAASYRERARKAREKYCAPVPIRPEEPAAVVPQAPEARESAELYHQWRETMKGCGKPVSLAADPSCRAAFQSYPLTVQRRIVEDAQFRATLASGRDAWNSPGWTPDPLEYLQSRVWDTKPIAKRTLPAARAPGAKPMLSDVANQVLAMAKAKEQATGGGG